MPTALSYIVWEASPTVFRIGLWSLGWYGLMWGLSVFLGYLQTLTIYRREGLATGYAAVLAEYVFFSGLIGARMGQVIFYDWAYFSQSPIEILKVWHGGLSSHGGALGILIGGWLFLRRYPHIGYMRLLDILALGAPLVGMLIRIGNLFNSEIVGKQTDVPWAFIFALNGDAVPRHPSQLYEALMLLGVWLLLWCLYATRRLPTGMLTGLFFALTFSLRFVLEYWKADAQFTQLLNLPLAAVGVAICVWAAQKKGHLPHEDKAQSGA
jgi:phosphatidylglycerol:prolipoprotein diacylglycerol transferase